MTSEVCKQKPCSNLLNVFYDKSLTLSTYIEDFPGLIHFIYINRRSNQVMAPALNITDCGDQAGRDATQLLKEKVGYGLGSSHILSTEFRSNRAKKTVDSNSLMR